MGYAPTFFGVDGMDGILDMPGFDTTLAEGLVLMTPFCATVESSKSFVDAYTAAYGTTPNQFAADAYDGVYIVKAALEQAGCTADMVDGSNVGISTENVDMKTGNVNMTSQSKARCV